MENKDCDWSDMDNVSIVNGELIDYEYDRYKQRLDKIKNIRRRIITAGLILFPAAIFCLVWIYIFNQIRV